MSDREHDATIEITSTVARIWVRSWQARDWIEMHVALAQVQTWTGSLLEVAPHYIGDLIAGMLADGLHIASVSGQTIAHRSQSSRALFLTCVSDN
jgi:hypothetical protein